MKEPRRAPTPHRAEGRTCFRRVHRQHELLPSHGRDRDKKGAILSEIAQASRRQYDPDIGRLSDEMPKFFILAGEFNSSLPLQAVKAGKFEGRYENALVELLNQKRKREPRDTGNVVNLMDALVGA
jgi:hypothetical protein